MNLWVHKVLDSDLAPVIPDGCQDLIIKYSSGDSPQFFISELMTTTNWISVFPGQEYHGLRLPPGTVIDWTLLKSAKKPENTDDLIMLANEFTFSKKQICESLSCISKSSSSVHAARDLGVSLRTLQRTIKKHTNKTPEFWRLLARSRKAARMILLGHSFAEIAHHCGFSDQAHMSRELKKWFGVTPNFIYKHSTKPDHWIQQVNATGYDAPLTGEHISIRKPLRSVT